jgi:hypothetical protein
MRAIVWITMMMFLGAPAAYALVDVGVDTHKEQSTGGQMDDTQRKTMESQQTKGFRESKSLQTGREIDVSDVIRAVQQAQKSTSMNLQVGLETLFVDQIARAEASGVEPFGKILIITNPPSVADFGLSANLPGGMIDRVKASWLSDMASSNARVEEVMDEHTTDRLRQYICDLAWYGAIVGQAYQYLNEDVNDLGGVDAIGYEDLMTLARGAFERAVNRIDHAMIKKYLDNIYRAVETQPALLAGSTDRIRIGSVMVILDASPSINVSGIQWYGQGKYAGFAGEYTVNTGWSYDNALEHLKNTRQYGSWAKSVENYTDDLESRGRTKEAVFVKSNAFRVVKDGRTSVSPASLLGGM